MALQTVNRLTSFFVTAGYDDLAKIKSSTGFLSRWGKGDGSITQRVEDSLEFSMDIVRNKKTIGKLLPRSNGDPMRLIGADAPTRTGQTWENIARDFPIIRGFSSVSRDEVMKYREPNELAITTNANSNLITKAGRKLARNVFAKMKESVGRMELAASQSLRLGTIALDDGTTPYDFGRSTDNTNTLSTLWSNVAADGFNDLSVHYKKVQRNGKGDPRAVVMAGDAFNAFLKLTLVKASADNRDISFIRAGDKEMADIPKADFVADMEANGFSYMAFYKDIKTGHKMYIFVYDEEYQNSSGTWIPFMPSAKVLFFDPDIRLDRFFGPGLRFDYTTPEERQIERMLGIRGMIDLPELNTGPIESWMFHHDVLSNGDKTNFRVETYTSPLYACTEVDSAGELTVL